MSKFLLDTNICIYFLKGKYDLISKIEKTGINKCFISEITVAELKYGAEKSERVLDNRKKVELFINQFTVIPIFSSLDIYSKEKARLSKTGTIIDDFDLLIGSTAISNEMTLVTNNTKHFNRLKGIKIIDWTV
jgi:tRNA(fMet)-specific endonuclease VapC